MGKLWALLDLFRKGNAVADPKLWKDRTALTLALTALILTAVKVAKGFGYDLPISETDAATLAAGIAVAVGLLGTYATTDKIGLPGLAPAQSPAADPVPPRAGPDPVPQRDRPARANPVDQHARDYPRDTGGGG